MDHEYSNRYEDFFVGFEGSFGSHHVTPRTLKCCFLNQMVIVEGIVSQCGVVRSKLVKSVSVRKTTGETKIVRSVVYPNVNDDWVIDYKDIQTIQIKELCEDTPPGQFSRVLDISCEYDLADICKVGDRVLVAGVYCCLTPSTTTGCCATFLEVNNTVRMSDDDGLNNCNLADVKRCRALADNKDEDIVELLCRSIAPSVVGHNAIKKAILCLLLGGADKKLPSGQQLRGFINMLVIGDTSVAKSQLLRYVLSVVPGIGTTGRGTSGVGLTAASSGNNNSGGRQIEAGAMVLANRGVVCINEFDKICDRDRTVLLEPMEQGTITITKAAIHVKLNASTSVLAAANTIGGRYNDNATPQEYIGIEYQLLSRFDLVFVMRDVPDRENDTKIAAHVINNHWYKDPRECDGEVLNVVKDLG